MHLTDKAAGFIGALIVGSTIPIAVGAALTATDCVESYCFNIFGDGAMEAGVVHERNFAATANFQSSLSAKIIYIQYILH